MINKFQKINKKNGGALLFELLIVISVLAIILSVGANAVFLSMRSNKTSGERDVAIALASETLEAVRAVVEEDWNNIYGLTKNSHYYPTESAGKWVLTETRDETVNINLASYTRYVVINNVSRDNDTRSIQGTYSSNAEDPSTQKVTVTVSWTGGNPITISEYFFRWKNKICDQSDWSGGAGSGAKDCSDNDNTHGGIDPSGTIDTSGGQLKLQ